jgi:hypothetical protein
LGIDGILRRLGGRMIHATVPPSIQRSFVMYAPFPNPVPPAAPPVRSRGAKVVAGMLAAAVALATFAVWFQWRQTRRCLGFYGGDVARLVQAAPRVELWQLAPGGGPSRPEAVRRIDVSEAPGLVHLRRGLVEDANFAWGSAADAARDRTWSLALAFSEAGASPAVLVFDTGSAAPAVAVAGRPGLLVPGPIAAGLRRWLADTAAAGAAATR